MNKFNYSILFALPAIAIAVALQNCTTTTARTDDQPVVQVLPVLHLKPVDVTTYDEFQVTIEGKRNVEIRPQVDGYLEEIFVDEGDFVKAGQTLFRINERPFREQLLNARGALLSAEANQAKAQLEVDRLSPLVKNNVVSDIQLKSAEASLRSAEAAVAQAHAMVRNAEINLGYTVIKAPVNGYVGRIPMKVGSLVGRGEQLPLTVVSDIQEVYAYFSMSEIDFLEFKEAIPGATLTEKLRAVADVELVLADDSNYPEKGRIETVDGQFDKTIGAITFRASFPNGKGLLRSGNTGRIRIPVKNKNVLAVPQESTFELQDKVLVFMLADSNKVVSQPIEIADQDNKFYFVRGGLKPGDAIVYSGLSRLRDGMEIRPDVVPADSLVSMN